jgi:hypothetical protein
MKKITITGFLILAVMFFGTCGAGLPGGDDEVMYTDVVYSEDMTRVTLYLDGTKVPVKRSAQRAMSTDVAKMTYDYLEVVFDAGTNGIARAVWDLGQSAGISGVYRSTPTDYTLEATPTGANAILLAGIKRNKTLLGIGNLKEINGTTVGATAMINTDTTSVTFELTAVKTALYANGDTAYADGTAITATNRPGATHVPTQAAFRFYDTAGTAPVAFLINSPFDSVRTTLAGVGYPIYSLLTYSEWFKSNPSDTTGKYVKNAGYMFGGGIGKWGKALYYWKSAVAADLAKIEIQKREPRYMDGGRYFTLRSNLDARTKVEYNGTKPTNGAQLSITGTATGESANDNGLIIPLKFTVEKASGGVFSFFIEIPVFALTSGDSTNGAAGATKWYIRTGLGSELYSIDDGVSLGGGVLMGVGVSAVDWIDIDWTWAP